MRKISVIAAVAICMMLAGCKKTHETVIKDTISNINAMTEILKGVKDEASAKAAAPKLEKLRERMKETGELAKKLGDPDKAESERLKKKYEKQLDEAMSGFLKEMQRLAMDPKFAEAMKAIGNEKPGKPGF